MIADAYGPVTIGAGTLVGEHCVLGFPKEARLRRLAGRSGQQERGSAVVIGENCLVFNHVVVYEGVCLPEPPVPESRPSCPATGTQERHDTTCGQNDQGCLGQQPRSSRQAKAVTVRYNFRP